MSSLSHLVLDAGAFILGSHIDSHGASVRYVTTPAVLSEIRDPKARHRYVFVSVSVSM